MTKAEKAKVRRIEKAQKKRQAAIEEAKQTLAHDLRFKCALTDTSYQAIEEHFQKRTYVKAFAAAQLCHDFQPITLRGLHYQMVSAGIYANTPQNYNSLKGVTKRLREEGLIPFEWIVDNTRATLKPSSWDGLEDYLVTVKSAYRKNFWAGLVHYVCVIVEKDAMAGALEPVTSEYDVSLHVIRGYSSLTFANQIARHWQQIRKPIFVYYLGDHDPSGRDLERDFREKLERYSGRNVFWKRLGVTPRQVDALDLPLPVKDSDSRSEEFIRQYGERTAELDALPPDQLRSLLEDAINSHIPQYEWVRLQEVESVEKEAFEMFLDNYREAEKLT